MSSAKELNDRFGIPDDLVFVDDPSGLVLAQINNSLASATLCLQGAHLMRWQPRGQAHPVVWLSKDAKLVRGKSIRGGIPVCWPWFGAHPTQAGFPAHGFARTEPWELLETGSEPDGATRMTLRLQPAAATGAMWPNACTLTLTLIIGMQLRLELATENTGAQAFVLGEALHTYFDISDIGDIQISGLDGREYWDTVGTLTLRKQAGDINFAGETDRIYINTADECRIVDRHRSRRIHVHKSGSLATVVWSPWTDKAARMGDLGQPDGWRGMVCVESVNTRDNAITLAPGRRHTLIVQYHVESV